MNRDELDRRVLEWIAEGAFAPRDDARFEALALELFAHQFEYNEAYARMCRSFGYTPNRVRSWREIPAVPTGAFKQARLAAFPASDEVALFRTSGSTASGPGELHLDTLALYEASLLATFSAFICPGAARDARTRFLVLAPSAADAPHSSLSYMFECAVRELGSEDSCFLVGADGWDAGVAVSVLRSATTPVAVVGTAFAFVHLLDALSAAGERIALPVGSRVMETGGFKGRSRELSRTELHAGIERALGVPRGQIVNQYGMCELGSQFYEDSLVTGVYTDWKRVPPWVRTRAVDPATFADVGDGEPGVLVHYDLVNTGSVLAVQTSDEGIVRADAFRVLGRVEGAEARGCSIAADALLSGAGPGAGPGA